MPGTSIVRKIYKWKPSTSRPVERHESGWEDVRNDLRKMKPIKWAEQDQNRLKWNFIVQKAKILSEKEEEEEEEEKEKKKKTKKKKK